MVSKTLFSSNTGEWETPQGLFDKLNSIFNFTLDVCADSNTAKCRDYFTKEDDGLAKKWDGVCWMNPPYGNPEQPCAKNCFKKGCQKRGYHITKYVPGVIDWVNKARDEFSSLNAGTVVCLLPARTDTNWFKTCFSAKYLLFLHGRLRFGSAKHTAPFPSVVVVFTRGNYLDRLTAEFKGSGVTIQLN